MALDNRALSIVGGVVALVLVLSILGATASTMFTAVSDINTAVSTNTTGDPTADTIGDLMPLLIGVSFILGLAGFVVAAIKFRK